MLKNSRKATKNFDFALTAVTSKDASGECTIEGYANTSTKDRVGDVVLPTAFEKSLPTYLKNPILLENHDWNKIAGRVIDAQITDKGLYIKARISDAREDLKTMVREKCLSTFSIGYNETDSDYDDATKTKFIKDLELLEISVVSVPANTEASFTVIDGKKDETPAETADGKSTASEDVSAQDLKSFIDAVNEAVGDEVTNEDVIALCDFYLTEGKEMGKKLDRKQLIEALRASVKSASASAKKDAGAADAGKTDAGKTDAGKADAPGAGQPADSGDAMKEISAKLDAIAQALAQLIEMENSEDTGEAPAAGGKPADSSTPPEGGKSADGEKSIDEMSEDELVALESELDAQLDELDDEQ